jgi:hypothetical protein
MPGRPVRRDAGWRVAEAATDQFDQLWAIEEVVARLE